MVSGVSTPENLLNPICVYVLAHFRAVKLLSNNYWAAIGVEIKYTYCESMVEIYIILMKSLLAPEAAFDFAVTGICIRTKVKKTSKFILA